MNDPRFLDSSLVRADGQVDKSKLERELSAAFGIEHRRKAEDEMKKRAILSAKSYDEFRHLVSAATLKPMQSREIDYSAPVAANKALRAGAGAAQQDGSSAGAAAAAAAAAVAKHQRLQALAAARTLEGAVRMVNSRRARQRNNMRPLLLDEGSLVRVSFLYAPTVRRVLKNVRGAAYLPKWSVELYRVENRTLAPGSRRVVLYTLRAVRASARGIGAPCSVGTQKVHLRLELEGVDRRYLQPVPFDKEPADDGGGDGDDDPVPAVTPTIAKRFPTLSAAPQAR